MITCITITPPIDMACYGLDTLTPMTAHRAWEGGMHNWHMIKIRFACHGFDTFFEITGLGLGSVAFLVGVWVTSEIAEVMTPKSNFTC